MNEGTPPSGLPPKEDPETLVLRGRPSPVVRFRRGLIIALTGGVASVLVALSWIALEPAANRQAASADEGAEPAREAAPDALANAPKNYGDVPRLGPPLPGDLGRPILEHQRSLETATAAPFGMADAEREASLVGAERERVAAAKAAARSSPMLVQLAQRTRPQEQVSASMSPSDETLPSREAATIPATQKHKIEFAQSLDGTLDAHVSRPPVSPWMLAAGTIIPASLITGLNSDLPGMVLAQVTENVRDSASGREILIPQGARLLGRYDSVIAYGQKRALVIWDRILFPDGSSLDIDNMPAADVSGYAGLADRVDSHTWQLIKGIALSTLLGVGTQLSFSSSESDLLRAIRESAQQNAAHAGDQMTSRNLDLQPTITVRPGWPVRAVLSKDIVLQPWKG
ncbi:TrbI/VirB10 family protein [Sphingomonas agri]|uniref:TrbI/VirB10 family protein n=1 Tax=Sphingomonas agri TaxID=1813878 RepID=UPI00311E375E